MNGFLRNGTEAIHYSVLRTQPCICMETIHSSMWGAKPRNGTEIIHYSVRRTQLRNGTEAIYYSV